MTKIELEKELVHFNLDKLSSAAKKGLFKLANLVANLTNEEWREYVINSTLDLKKLAEKADISRSSLYQNDHIKKYLLLKAEMLVECGEISVVPYKALNLGGSNVKTKSNKEAIGNDREEGAIDSMAKELAFVKKALKETRVALQFYIARDEQIFSTGRVPY